MDEKISGNENKEINIVIEHRNNNRNPKTILSNLFKDYQNKEKDPASEDNEKKKKNTINDLKIQNEDEFSIAIIKKLEEIKDNSIKRIRKSIDKYTNSYGQFQKKILKFIEEKGDNLSKVINNNFKNDFVLKYVINNIFNIINHNLEVYDNILNNIEDNFILLNDFLDNGELINQKKPREYFLNNNYKYVLNCSLLNKFNFKEIDSTKITQNNYYKNYFNFLKEEKNNEVIKTFTLRKEEIKKGLQFMKDNFSSIENLQIHGIDTSDLEKIVDIIPSQKRNNILNKIKVRDFDFTARIDVEKLQRVELNKIQKLKFITGKYFYPGILLHLFLNTTDCLVNLALEKVNMSNIGLNKLMNIFKRKPIILDTLEYLSLAGNSISAVKNEIFQTDEMKNKSFKKLKIMNFHKNNIYKFEIGLDKMPELILLDLTSNSILTGAIMENMIKEKKKLILFNDNIFITNNFNNNNTYINYLNKQLPNLDFGVKVLHLGFTYDKEKEEHLEKLNLSPSMKISLIKLDLSFCGITTKVLTNFLKNNYGLFSLKKLKLKYNNLDSKIFGNLLSDQISLENLNILDLSENEVPCKEYDETEGLVKFIEKYKNLEQIKFMNSCFIDRWTTSISPDLDVGGKFRQLYTEFKDNIKKDNRKFIFVIDSDNWNFVENEFEHLFSFRAV